MCRFLFRDCPSENFSDININEPDELGVIVQRFSAGINPCPTYILNSHRRECIYAFRKGDDEYGLVDIF